FLGLGGKRIRPILTLLGAELFGTDKKQALPQALSIEVFHNFTLIHDDIMDDAPVRRNQTTVHEKWGNNVAILSGDVLLIKAYQLLADIAPEHLAEALALFNTTAAEVCEGQQMDMNFEERMDVSIAEYLEMIRLKTSVLLGAALKMGAIVANASEKDQGRIYGFGQNIGLAFQIQDDILDLYADPTKFGKQVGGDVIANKKTILHLTAIGNATREQLEIIKQLQTTENIELKVKRTRELFDHLEVKQFCENMMQEYYQKAMNYLEEIDVNPEQKKPLIALASYLMDREI
ncbi:MAG: polyprenyl synthetase family protein, partial [Crocinitomicaceae bacterium]|nr:polyprenyl synthetase family protein [Crocinitomicaceae bacterium]